MRIDMKDGAAGTVRKTMWLAASGGGFVTATQPWQWQLPANTALVVQLSASPATNDVRVNIDYCIMPVP